MPPRNEHGREAVSALATVTVVVGGSVVLVFVIVTGSNQPGPYLAGLAAAVVVVTLLLFLLRTRPDKSHKRQPWYKIFRRAAARTEPQILVERRDDPGPGIKTNQPPTAEQVRDLKDHASTWVPNRATGRQAPPMAD